MAVIISIAIGVFLAVTLIVGGLRALKTLDAHKARIARERRDQIARRASNPEYRGPMVNHWGRETDR